MADLGEVRIKLKEHISSTLNEKRFIATAHEIIDDVIDIAEMEKEGREEAIRAYYRSVTGTEPYVRPKIRFRARKARVILMARDAIEGIAPRKRYAFGEGAEPRRSVFEDAVDGYVAWMAGMGFADATIKLRRFAARVLFGYLEGRGIASLASLDATTLTDFIAWLDGRYTQAGKSNILYSIRNLFSCPTVGRELSFDPAGLLCNLHSRKHTRIPSVYSAEEVSAVMAAIDRDTDAGRTLYLAICLAAVYGLRQSDVKRLRIDDVDFRAKTISIVQHKTGVPLLLPLIECVELPLLDYLMRTRRECEHREVLIRHVGAAEPYSLNTGFSNDLRDAFSAAGVMPRGRRIGLHSLRHSLATGLLASGVPLNDISAVLGHSSPESTKKYIWSDVEHLRIAALEVE